MTNQVLKHKIMVHSKQYTKKPNSKEAGLIQKQIYAKENHLELTIREIGNEVTCGKTIKVGHFTGSHKEDYVPYSNSLLVIDVDNKYDAKDDKGNKKVCYTDYTVDDIMSHCESCGLPVALMYTTFSHTDTRHKCRLLFQLSRTVTMQEWEQCLKVVKGLLGIAGEDEYGIADKQVSTTHLTYGGRNLILVDENAVLDVEALMNQSVFHKNASQNKAQSVDNTSVAGKRTLSPKSTNIINNTLLDMGDSVKDSAKLVISRAIDDFCSVFLLKSEKKSVKTEWGAIEYAKSIPLNEILGVELKTHCLFHEDKHPSAGFFKDNCGAWYYKCFSCNAVYDITDFIAMKYDLDKKQDFAEIVKHITALFHIEIERDKWVQTCHANFHNNEMYFYRANKYKDDYPLTNAGMVFTHGIYAFLLMEARASLEYISARDKDGAPLVSVSRKYIAQRTGLTEDKVRARLQRLLNMGFIRILSDEEVKEVSEELYQLSHVTGNKTHKTISIYAIYTLSHDLLNESEKRLKTFKDKGGTARGATARQSLAVYDGLDNTFIKSTGDTQRVMKDREVLMTWAKRELERKGYILKESYLRYAQKRGYSERYALTFIAEINNGLELKTIRVTKEAIKKYGLPETTIRKTMFIKNDN